MSATSLEKVVSAEVNSGQKFDQEKTRYDLFPPEAMDAICQILTFGAKKYGDRNWEKGMKWGRLYGALLRHLFMWASGQRNDDETGKSHLWHAGCCIVFLITYEDRRIGENDIWPSAERS
jgi:hypothetical protein